MENLDYRAETCSSPIGETGDYDSWIELVTPDFNMQCYDPDVELEQVEELANMLNVAKNCNIHNVTNRTFSADDVKVLLEKQKQLCANEFIHAEMTMEQAKRRVLNAPTVSF